MPVLTFANLLKGQPAVSVFVGPPAGWNESRETQGLAPSYPVEAVALIDTGAARTLIVASLVSRLGLPIVGDAPEVFGIGVEGRPVPAAGVAVSLTFADGPPVFAATAPPIVVVPAKQWPAPGSKCSSAETSSLGS